MANVGYFKQLKELVYDFTDSNGNVLNTPKGRIAKKELDDSIIKCLRRLVILLLHNDMLREETRIYISDLYITYNGVADKLKEKYGKEVNANTVQTKLWNDKGKITRYLGESMLVDLIEYQDIDKVEEYEERLDKAYEKFGNYKVLDNIALELPEITDKLVDKIEQERFNQFIEIIGPYTKKHMEFISSMLDKDVISYCKYILSTNSLTGEDKDNKEVLKELLS